MCHFLFAYASNAAAFFSHLNICFLFMFVYLHSDAFFRHIVLKLSPGFAFFTHSGIIEFMSFCTLQWQIQRDYKTENKKKKKNMLGLVTHKGLFTHSRFLATVLLRFAVICKIVVYCGDS